MLPTSGLATRELTLYSTTTGRATARPRGLAGTNTIHYETRGWIRRRDLEDERRADRQGRDRDRWCIGHRQGLRRPLRGRGREGRDRGREHGRGRGVRGRAR